VLNDHQQLFQQRVFDEISRQPRSAHTYDPDRSYNLFRGLRIEDRGWLKILYPRFLSFRRLVHDPAAFDDEELAGDEVAVGAG
jgi:hypothetical protein